MRTVTINGTNRSSLVKFKSLFTEDRVNQANDTARFTVEQHTGQTYKPAINEEVLVHEDSTLVWGGVIIEVTAGRQGDTIITHEVRCKDFTQYLDRKIITERYEDMTASAIVLDLLSVYAAAYGFTGTNVGGSDVNVNSISFNGLTMSQSLDKLAKLIGYYWYVDFEKDIHFFKKNTEAAPFNLTDTSNNYIFDSLTYKDDLSQIRNKVTVRGGEAIAESRSENYAGNGEQTTFPLANKFSALPTVTVDAVAVTVGIDFLNDDASYDAMWSFQEKSLRFTAGNIPPSPGGGDTTNIVITGLPLKPIIVQRQNNASVALYGVYEFIAINDSLTSRDEALQYAAAELEAYAEGIKSASFDTYTSGLRSGQVISIVSDEFGIAEQFIIQSVKSRQETQSRTVWSVELATVRVLDLIDVLSGLLMQERIAIGEDETLLTFEALTDGFSMDDSMAAPVVTDTEDYLWEAASDVPYSNPIVWDKFTWAA